MAAGGNAKQNGYGCRKKNHSPFRCLLISLIPEIIKSADMYNAHAAQNTEYAVNATMAIPPSLLLPLGDGLTPSPFQCKYPKGICDTHSVFW